MCLFLLLAVFQLAICISLLINKQKIWSTRMNISPATSQPPVINFTRSTGSYADHEPGLWRAVITQALMDAASRSRKTEARRYRTDALSWLLSGTDDFEAVCDNAGLDPDYVRSRARTAL